ncbi:hypothetical protein WAI453_013245 [Rhynchosporium graminicola]
MFWFDRVLGEREVHGNLCKWSFRSWFNGLNFFKRGSVSSGADRGNLGLQPDSPFDGMDSDVEAEHETCRPPVEHLSSSNQENLDCLVGIVYGIVIISIGCFSAGVISLPETTQKLRTAHTRSPITEIVYLLRKRYYPCMLWIETN